MVGADSAWVRKARSLHHLFQRMQGLLVKVKHAVSFGGHMQGFLAVRILRGYPRGAVAGVAGLRLNATQCKHKAACRVAPVSAQRHHADDIKRADHFASAAQANTLAQVHTL